MSAFGAAMRLVRSCPVCEAPVSEASVFLEESIDVSRISGFSFASRKEPDTCPTG